VLMDGNRLALIAWPEAAQHNVSPLLAPLAAFCHLRLFPEITLIRQYADI